MLWGISLALGLELVGTPEEQRLFAEATRDLPALLLDQPVVIQQGEPQHFGKKHIFIQLDPAQPAERVRRQLVHALIHRLDLQEGWSEDSRWRDLSEWEAPGDHRPGEKDPFSYAAIEGMRSAAEDLATLAEAYFARELLLEDTSVPVACRMRAKWRFFYEKLQLPPTRAPSCASLEQVGLGGVKQLELILVQASAKNPASLAGHFAVALSYESHIEVYQLVAETHSVNPRGPLYALLGLIGGFDSVVVSASLPRMILSYGYENRSLQRFKLKFSKEEQTRFLERLDDIRQSWQRPYLFVGRNCTFVPRQLVEWALNQPLKLPPLFTPDMLLGLLERMGRLEPIARTRLEEFSLDERAQAAARLRSQLAQQFPSLKPIFQQTLSHNPEARAKGYQALLAEAQNNSALQEPVRNYLVWSEEIERANPKPTQALTSPVLWQAQGQLPPAPPSDLLLSSLNTPVSLPGSRAHTPARRQKLEAGIHDTTPFIGYSSSFFHYRLGEARRYLIAEGLDLRLLDLNLQAGFSEDLMLASSLSLLRLRRVKGSAPFGNPGFYIETFDIQRRIGQSLNLKFAEAGGLLELAQADHHRFHLGISAGVAGGGSIEGGLFSGNRFVGSLQFPIRLFGRIGSAQEPLTGLEWEGAWWLSPDSISQWELALGTQLRIGEIFGADLAVALNGKLGSETRSAGLGLWVEPH